MLAKSKGVLLVDFISARHTRNGLIRLMGDFFHVQHMVQIIRVGKLVICGTVVSPCHFKGKAFVRKANIIKIIELQLAQN